MKSLNIFSANELHRHVSEIIQNAEKGEVSLIIKQNRPSFVAVPFDERLLNHGISKAMAIDLFQAGLVTLSQAARIAALPIENFIELLGEEDIYVVDYPPDDLDSELDI